MSRLRQLGKDSSIYGIGAIFAKGIGFFLLPVYTRIFTPIEYGAIEMLTVITSFLSAFLAMGMDSAQSYFFFEQKDSGKLAQARVVSAILQWRLSWGLAIIVVATALSPALNALLFEGRLNWAYFAIAFGGAFFQQVMSQSVEVLRLLYRPWPYVLIQFAEAVGAAGLVMIFVVVANYDIVGYFLGSMLAASLVACLGWYLIRGYIDFGALHTNWWPRLLRFGAPLLPAGLAMYFMSATDRWFIQYYHGAAVLGVYAIGAKFAMLMLLAIETFRKAWWPIALDAMHSEDGPDTFRMIGRLYMGLGVAAVIYLTFLSPWLVRWFAAPPFFQAWPVVGILAWQSLFYGFYMVASAGIWKVEKTYITMYLMVGAALINIALNYLLVPSMGGLGAALATATTYFIWVMLSMFVSERLWKIGLPINIILVQIAAGVLTVLWLIKVQLSQAVPSYQVAAVTHGVVAVLIYSSFDGHYRKTIINSIFGR